MYRTGIFRSTSGSLRITAMFGIRRPKRFWRAYLGYPIRSDPHTVDERQLLRAAISAGMHTGSRRRRRPRLRLHLSQAFLTRASSRLHKLVRHAAARPGFILSPTRDHRSPQTWNRKIPRVRSSAGSPRAECFGKVKDTSLKLRVTWDGGVII